MELVLTADPTRTTGTRPSRRLRREGQIPAVVYGLGSDPIPVSVVWRDLRQCLKTEAGTNVVINLDIEGTRHLSLVKDIQRHKVRRDVREGRPGTRLELATTVVDVSTCKPIRGAAVDIWHCDAGGVYSGFAQEGTEGETFMRGIQRTDRKGVARFTTIYPGWYSGRTVHIHVQVSAGGNVLHMGQLFFPERLTDAVFRRAPYNRRPNRDTRNAADSIFRNGGARSMLKLTRQGSGYIGRITMGISRS